jgi:hypothetical protein
MLKTAATRTNLNHIFILHFFIYCNIILPYIYLGLQSGLRRIFHLYLGLPSGFFLRGVPMKFWVLLNASDNKYRFRYKIYILNGRIYETSSLKTFDV